MSFMIISFVVEFFNVLVRKSERVHSFGVHPTDLRSEGNGPVLSDAVLVPVCLALPKLDAIWRSFHWEKGLRDDTFTATT